VLQEKSFLISTNTISWRGSFKTCNAFKCHIILRKYRRYRNTSKWHSRTPSITATFRISIDEVCLLSPSSRPTLLPLAICGNCLTGRHVHRRPPHLPNAAVSFCVPVDSFCLDVVVVCLFYNFFVILLLLQFPQSMPIHCIFLRIVFAVLYSYACMETSSSFDLHPAL